jgi:predicted amidophosphoribosyltransferase
MRDPTRSMFDVVFPRRCAGCRAGPWPFCAACTEQLEPLRPPWCERCGRPWPRPVEGCRDCPPPPVSSARAAFAFEGPARAAIHRLKFAGWRDVASALGGAMVQLDPPAADAVTWVPLARRRRAERGFDQAQALARPVAGALGLPLVRLVRRRASSRSQGGSQARRSAAERRRAMRGAYLPTGRPAPARVLLVDDVLTTGATAAACAEALAAAGAREIHLLTAVRSFARPRERRASAYTRPGSRAGLWLPGDDPR